MAFNYESFIAVLYKDIAKTYFHKQTLGEFTLCN